MKRVSSGRAFLRCFLFCLITPFVSSLIYVAVLFLGITETPALLVSPAVIALAYVLFRKKLIPSVSLVNGIIAGVLALVFSFLMWVNDGEASGMVMFTYLLMIPVCPGFMLLSLMDKTGIAIGAAVLLSLFAFCLSFLLQKSLRTGKKGRIIASAAAVVCIGLLLFGDLGLYRNRPSVRYAGHGFQYMHGWSSTDFTDYMVYSEHSKLAALDHPASLTIEGVGNMPVMDGAEACYPLYAAIAKAVYKDIDRIEEDFVTHGAGHDGGSQAWLNGRVVTFTNTIQGFERLIERGMKGAPKADLFFGARPSKDQMAAAAEWHTEIEITPIGREAFVFFVEPDNPVTGLTSEEIRKIYSGEITNWSELGGKNEKIRAFQRPANSGSQTMMEYFMGDTALKEPLTYERIGSMEGVIKEVAQYNNERGALGYSFRYFVEDLNQENNVRMLLIDGVAPTIENIENGSYPLTVDLCLVTRANDDNPNVRKMIDYCLSEEGQEIIKKTGYAGVSKEQGK